MGNYIYKYVLNDEIIYIGKTKKLDSRIYQHSIEEKFKPHLKESAIFYFECANSVEMDLIERAFINQYKPELNVVDKLEGFSGCITVKDLEWHKYEKQERQEKTEQKTKKRKETEFGRYERYDRMLHNKKVADVYRYIRKQMAIKNYMDCDNFDLPCSVDKENKVAMRIQQVFIQQGSFLAGKNKLRFVGVHQKCIQEIQQQIIMQLRVYFINEINVMI